MKTIDGPSKIKYLSLMLLSLLIMGSCYIYHNYNTYHSIQLDVIKNATVEYGSGNYDFNNYIEKIEGKIVSIKNDIDTEKIGEQEVLVEVKKENMVKEIPVLIQVVDTVAPVIELKEQKISIVQGNTVNFQDNVTSVSDEVDGSIGYLEEVKEDSNFYYHLDYDSSSINNVGEHEIKVLAKDKNGNETVSSFTLEVVAPPPKKVYTPNVYHNLPANANSGDLASIAYSLVGMPYVSKANGPYAFDCSGLVQYVYAQKGIHVSRSTSTQIYDGVGVPYEEAQPGDILSWAYSYGNVTHSAMYVGNGKMVHAANPSMGVIVSDVSYWQARSGTKLLSVRRIQ
jgi:cell wall-associated NlpC family hydrolase